MPTLFLFAGIAHLKMRVCSQMFGQSADVNRQQGMIQ